MKLSPILLFTYKRKDSLIKVIDSLKKNIESRNSDLYVFSDGPKNDSDVEKVKEVRQFLDSISGFKNVYIDESPYNLGLANSIINGVGKVINRNDSVIVLEDDLVVTENFLSFMNQSLNKYQDNPKVFSISGYSFDFGDHLQNSQSYFLSRGWSWGWGTWKDRWEFIDWEMKDYGNFSKNLKMQRDFSEGGSDLNSMLRKQMTGKIDSWAIRWFYHQFKVSGITLYPFKSKVLNIGFDNFATHTKGSNRRYNPNLDNTSKKDFIFPEISCVDKVFQKKFKVRMGKVARVRSRIESMIKKLTF